MSFSGRLTHFITIDHMYTLEFVLLVSSVAFAAAHQFPFPQFTVKTAKQNPYFGNQAVQNVLLQEILPFPVREYLLSPQEEVRNTSEQDEPSPTPTCDDDIDELLAQLGKILRPGGTDPPSAWALQMIDAWGKIPSGLLSGNTKEPGDFLECVNIKATYNTEKNEYGFNVTGKYCTTIVLPAGNLSLPGLMDIAPDTLQSTFGAVGSLNELLGLMAANGQLLLPSIGTCFPASCSNAEINIYLQKIFGVLPISATAALCTTSEKPKLTVGADAMIVLLFIIAFLCVMGTVLENLPRKFSSLGISKVITAFSLKTNMEKILSTRSSPDDLGCLHGIRYLSLAWVVLGHTWAFLPLQFNANGVDMVNLYKDWTYMPILNATLSVDTFFVMSGALMAYNLLKELDRSKGKLNYPLLVLHRFLRLTPTYMILIGAMATVVPYFGNGPTWYAVDALSRGCKENWWHNLFYVNNLVKYDDPAAGECYTEGWYLANDMQFFLVAPLVVYPLWAWPKIGYALLATFSAVSIGSTAALITSKDILPTQNQFNTDENSRYYDIIYKKPWTRCGTYVVGLSLGYILHQRRTNPQKFANIPKYMVALGWVASTALALLVLYGPFPYWNPENVDLATMAWHSRLYGAVHRFIWGVAIAWIIFACVNGNGGVVNEFLSWEVFLPLGRISFCLYIASFVVQLVYCASQNLHPIYVGGYSMTYAFLGHLVTSTFVAFVLTLAIESPVIQLEKMVFGKARGKVNEKGIGKGNDSHAQSGPDVNANNAGSNGTTTDHSAVAISAESS